MQNKISEKKCPKCGEVKSIRDFSKDKGKKDGYNYCCRACKNKLDTTYRSTELGYLKSRYDQMLRKGRKYKRLLTLEEFLAAWAKHKSIYGMKSAWGPGIHNLEKHKLMTTITLGKGQRGKSGNIKGSKQIGSNISADRLDSNKDYTAHNIIFIRGDENARKKNTTYEDCKIQIRLHEERFRNRARTLEG